MDTEHVVIGAGPGGLVAAATLARAGHRVSVYEKADQVGHRFAGDFQGLENWSALTTADRLASLGIEPGFEHQTFHEVTFYDHRLRPTVGRSREPLFTLVKRGPVAGTLDRALLDQARDAGADVFLGHPATTAHRGDIVAIGPRYADGLATGYVFPTRLDDQAHCIVSEAVAPAGYAYLIVWNGRATLATCLFRDQHTWKTARDRTVAAFRRVVPGLDLDDARPFSGFGSVFGAARFTDEAGRLFVGEAAGLQDPEWGFGMWYAMESGRLAARSLIDGFDYATTAEALFEKRREAAFANRLLYECLPAPLVALLLRRGASALDLRDRIRRHCAPSTPKSLVARVAIRGFTLTRLRHRDRACHRPTCDCVWCTHGDADCVA